MLYHLSRIKFKECLETLWVVHDEKWLYFYNQTYNRRDRPYLTKTNVTALNWIVTQSDHRRMSFARANTRCTSNLFIYLGSFNDEQFHWIWFWFLFNLFCYLYTHLFLISVWIIGLVFIKEDFHNQTTNRPTAIEKNNQYNWLSGEYKTMIFFVSFFCWFSIRYVING